MAKGRTPVKGLTISKIEEVYDEYMSEYEKGDGYRLTFSDNQTYSILIANDQNCCESFGYLASEDDLSDFVGAEIDSIGVTDTELSSEFLKQIYHESDSDDLLEIADCVFLTIHTTKGLPDCSIQSAQWVLWAFGVYQAQ